MVRAITEASRITFFAVCWCSDVRKPHWPGGSLKFQFNETMYLFVEAAIQNKISESGLFRANREIISISTWWICHLGIQALGETISYMGYCSKTILHLINEIPNLAGYCLPTDTVNLKFQEVTPPFYQASCCWVMGYPRRLLNSMPISPLQLYLLLTNEFLAQKQW